MFNALSKFGILEKKQTSPLDEFFHKVDDTAGYHDAEPIEPSRDVKSIYHGVNLTCSVKKISQEHEQCSTAEEPKPLERKRRNLDIPFYLVGNGYTFNQEAYDEVCQGLLMYTSFYTNSLSGG